MTEGSGQWAEDRDAAWIKALFEKVTVYFLWFVAGTLFGYLWMAKAYELF